MLKPATMKDIAVALGISVSTVSRALSDSYEINQDTKKKILAYAKSINFQHNPMAVSLKNGRSNSIGLIVCDVANYFFSQIIDGIESVAYENDFHLIITQSHDDYRREVTNINHLSKKHVDGLLVAMASTTTNFNHFNQFTEKGIPIVLFERSNQQIQAPSITINNYNSSFIATTYLISNGCKKIAFLGHAAHLSTTQERQKGYLDALHQNQIAVIPEFIKYCTYGGSNLEEVERTIHELFLLKEEPDAVFIASDSLSNACLLFLRKFQQHKNILLTGFNNSDMAEIFSPSFSFIRQPAFDLGQQAIKKLINMITEKEKFDETEFKVLESTFFPNHTTSH